MRRPTVARRWVRRLVTGAVIGAIGFVLAVVANLDPEPVPYVVVVALVLMLAWLVVDTIEAEASQWTPPPPSASDRVDEATSDLRVLTSHQQAGEPSGAVRDRLVALARTRDPDLAATIWTELTPTRRIPPAEIDSILTRIEGARDRS